MKFRAALIILLLLLQSACGHLRGLPSDDAIGHPTNETATENSVEVPPKVAASSPPQNASRAVDTTLPPGDLLNRMRAGFAFPHYKSKQIKDYIRWSTKHPNYLNNLFARAEPFLFYVLEEIEKRQLPTELALLPAIESAYKPDALSGSNASGLWQFIPSTGTHYGLRQDWWYDARRDAITATTAALDYLTELNKLFDGDWFLTLAAYNAGQGTVLRAMKANRHKRRGTNYRDLNLRKETERYVPKLLALKEIIANPEKFGVSLPVMVNQPHFEIVTLPGQIDLHRFADEIEIELATLMHLNAGYRRWATDPDGPHRLLVPVTAISKVDAALEKLKFEPTVQYRHHQIKRGDNLSSIARRYGVSVAALKQANKLHGTSIRAGRALLVPVANRAISQTIRPLQETRSDVAKTQDSENVVPTRENEQFVHRVIAGDTLWSIARRYQVRVAQLMSWNNLSAHQVLSLDQALTVFMN